MSFIVAMDGPAGTGKGTITKLVAQKLGLVNIDTGATYRCVTLAMLRENVGLEQEDKIKEILEKSKIELKNENGKQLVFLNGEDVSKQIRSQKVNELVSQVSSLKFVRYKMVDFQRKLAEDKDIIMEGRDIGTYVFPNADVKIYLDATAEERARRRQRQNEENGIESTYKEVLANIIKRDENDKNKEMGALKIADDAIVVDGTYDSIEQNTQKVIDIINEKKNNKNVGARDIVSNNQEQTTTVGSDLSQKNINQPTSNNVGGGLDQPTNENNTQKDTSSTEPILKKVQREIIRTILWLIYKIIYRVKVIGKENVPQNEAFILCGNHVEFIKVPIIELFTTGRRRVFFMAKIELLKNPLFKWLAYLFDVIPVKRGKKDLNAIKQSLKVIQQGHILGIFPEGTRNKTNKPIKAKTGTAYMALRTGSKVLPVGIKTTKHKKVIVNIGKPLDYSKAKTKNPEKELLEQTTKQIMDEIIMLTETAN